MYDKDGVMRHSVLYVEPDDGDLVYSMAYVTASKYAEKTGMTITEPPVNDRGQFYVSFTGGPTDYYDGVTLSMLIKGEVPSSYYKNKIVLIGPLCSRPSGFLLHPYRQEAR